MANGIISGIKVPRNFTLAQRLEFYSMPEPNSGCLLWLGHASGHAKWNAWYGYLTWEGRSRGAHIWAWEEANGRPVPDGQEVCHKCDIGLCIAEAHLFLGGHIDNMIDMARKGRSGGQKLTPQQVIAIRADARRHKEIAVSYGVSKASITHIKSGRNWKHLHGVVLQAPPTNQHNL